MKKKIFSILLTLALVLSFSLVTAVPVAAVVGEAWVDDDFTSDTTGWNVTHFDTIQEGIDAVAAVGTVNVAAGDYPERITIDTDGLTLLGANEGIHPAVGTHPTETVGTRVDETVLSQPGTLVVVLAADDITIDGFKFTGKGLKTINSDVDANNFHLTNCIFDTSESFESGGVLQFASGSHTDYVFDFNLFQDPGQSGYGGTIYTGGDFYRFRLAYNQFIVRGNAVVWTAIDAVDVIIEGNEFDGTNEIAGWRGYGGFDISRGGNIVIRDNWFHDGHRGARVGIVSGSITGNTFEEIYDDDIELYDGWGGSHLSTDVLIEDNTITYNDVITDRDKSGIVIDEDTTDGSTIHIHNNDFIDGGLYPDVFAIEYLGDPGTRVDALYNWWGDETGPDHATLNTGAQGGSVSDNVNFSPWLYEPKENFVSDAPFYAGSVVIATEASEVIVGDVTSFAGGWNSFSTPVTLVDTANTWGELLVLTAESNLFIERAMRFDTSTQQWVSVVMGNALVGGVDYQIKPGEGFFIQVSTKGSLPILCHTDATWPPMTNLLAGWNLVGLSNLTSMTVANALSFIDYSVVLSASPPNDEAWSVPPDTNTGKLMLLGEAYWVAMGEPGILFGFTTTPVADDMKWDLNQ